MYNAGDRVRTIVPTILGDRSYERAVQVGDVGMVTDVFRAGDEIILEVEFISRQTGARIVFSLYDWEVEPDNDSRDNARSAVLVSGAIASVGEARRLSDAAWGILFIWLVVIGVALGTLAVGWAIAEIVGY